MAKGLTISCEQLHQVTTDVKLFNGQVWEIRKGGNVFRFTTRFVNGNRSKRVYFEASKLEDIYSMIKILYDKKGREVASRLNENSRLLTTRHNKLWYYAKKEQKQIDQAFMLYVLVEAIRDKEYKETIQNYWEMNEKQMK
ncbi:MULTISPECIES: hypothetical protein [Vagococcus]|uniref:hypothetical protein n=1 Tax=Vagococcus TaxID=2737 RepID=UPI002890CCA4|nr:hypothetical protein [Vagococcus carniphilus]MDT2832142.1 hypothetical protein [Vagococcus carniphilus]MDT2840976.1 hypothetical protein [Vagococcus carniphilus]MDT2855587.1 hypothetical protein [Vagococcus carniphilus]